MRAGRRTRRGGAGVKIVGAVAAAAAAVAAGWVAIDRSAGGAVASSNDLARVSTGSFDITTIATGDLQARNQVEIRSELDVRTQIIEIVPEGTRVKSGDVLVRLNSEEIETEIQEDRLQVAAAQAELTSAQNAVLIQQSENESRLRKAVLALDLAELALRQWQEGDHKKREEELRIAVEKAERDYERLRDKAENSKTLYERNFKSKNDYELDQINAKEAESHLHTTRLEQKIYETYVYPREERQKNSDVNEAREEVERVKIQNQSQLASEEADLANRERQYEIRKNNLDDLEEQLVKCVIRAPKDGLVVYWASTMGRWYDDGRGVLQVGREVNPREPLIVLPDTSEMIASVQVHESIAGRVDPGQHALVTVDALSGATISGVVDSVGVLAEAGGWRDPNLREYTVRIALKGDETTLGLKPSMRCEAEIRLGRVEDALAVPIASIFNEGSLHYVYTPRDGKFERVPVRVGRRSSTEAEIVAGLEQGQQVLAREPASTEVWPEPWDVAELELVGFTIGTDGRPARIGAPPGGVRRAPDLTDPAELAEAAPDATGDDEPAPAPAPGAAEATDGDVPATTEATTEPASGAATETAAESTALSGADTK